MYANFYRRPAKSRRSIRRMVNSSNDLWRYGHRGQAFRIECEALQVPIPMKWSGQFKSALKDTNMLKSLMIREFKFDSVSWTNVSQGLIKAKNITALQLQFYRFTITKKNLPYLVDVVEKAKFKLSIRLLHVSFENDKIFDTFLDLVKKHPQLESIVISKDLLTNGQQEIIVNLQNIIEQISIDEPKIIQVTGKIVPKTIFDTEFVWMNEKNRLLAANWITKNLLYLQEAISSSKLLKKVNFTSASSSLKLLNAAFQANESIKKLTIGIDSDLSAVARLCTKKDLRVIFVVNYGELKHAIKQMNKLDLDTGHAIAVTSTLNKNFDILSSTTKLSTFFFQNCEISSVALKSLANHTRIQKLSLVSCALNENASDSLAEVILRMNLTNLQLIDVKVSKEDLPNIEKAILVSTSLRSLTFQSALSLDTSLDNIFHSTTLTKIRFGFSNRTKNCDLPSLRYNTTLKKLILPPLSMGELVLCLQENHSLTHLVVRKSPYSPHGFAALDQEEGLINLLKASDTLQRIDFCYKEEKDVTAKLSDFSIVLWKCCEVALKTNKVLSAVSLHVETCKPWLEPPLAVEKALQSNKEQQYQALQTRLFIRQMAARPQIYLAFLPLEVWAIVFSFIDYIGVKTDYRQLVIKSCGF